MGFSPDQIKIIMDFIKAREIKRIPNDTLFDDPRWLNREKSKVDVARWIQPTELVDPVTRESPQYFEGERLKVVDGGAIKKASDDSSDGTEVIISVENGLIWELLIIQCSFLADANVADRSAELRIPDSGMGGIAGTNPSSLFGSILMTLSANQYGYFTWMPDSGFDRTANVDNGIRGSADKILTGELWLNAGAEVRAILSVNAQATDKTGLDILYKEHTLRS